MSGGLVGLLDDVAALARLAAASVDDVGAAASRASVKAAGVVIDDTAVTPQYVQGVAAKRELPIIWRITRGSLRNKLLIILPVALLLSQFAEWALMPLLMVGGTYLCYEGAHKILHALQRHEDHEVPATLAGPEAEQTLIAGAIRTDFVLSAEIMVIALNEVADEPFWTRVAVLGVVAVAITAVVYGVVGLIVKMDDIGLLLARRTSTFARKVGRGLVRGMPILLNVLSVVGVAAMLWVGGHLIIVGADDVGWSGPYELVHDLSHHAEAAGGAVLGWLSGTVAAAVLGLVLGAVVVGLDWLVRVRILAGLRGRTHRSADAQQVRRH